MEQVSGTTQQNLFPQQNIPPNTSDFYNNPQFLQNEIHIFAHAISQMSDGLNKGLEEIKKSINN